MLIIQSSGKNKAITERNGKWAGFIREAKIEIKRNVPRKRKTTINTF